MVLIVMSLSHNRAVKGPIKPSVVFGNKKIKILIFQCLYLLC